MFLNMHNDLIILSVGVEVQSHPVVQLILIRFSKKDLISTNIIYFCDNTCIVYSKVYFILITLVISSQNINNETRSYLFFWIPIQNSMYNWVFNFEVQPFINCFHILWTISFEWNTFLISSPLYLFLDPLIILRLSPSSVHMCLFKLLFLLFRSTRVADNTCVWVEYLFISVLNGIRFFAKPDAYWPDIRLSQVIKINTEFWHNHWPCRYCNLSLAFIWVNLILEYASFYKPNCRTFLLIQLESRLIFVM